MREMRRGVVNRQELRTFMFYAVVLIACFFCCWEDSGARMFLVVSAAMLLGSIFEIPLFEMKTRKPGLSDEALGVLGEIYKVRVLEEVREGSARAYNTTVTLNAGGFLIPVVFAIFLLFSEGVPYFECSLSYFLMTIIAYSLSEFRTGIGIVVPSYVGILAIPLAIILAPSECNCTCLASLVFVPAILGICTGILITLVSFPKEKHGSAFINIGGAVGDCGFSAVFIVSLLSTIIASM